METVASVAAKSVFVVVYLFAGGSHYPDCNPINIPPGSYSFTSLRNTVVPLLLGGVEFSNHQLRAGRWFILPKPPSPGMSPVLEEEGILIPEANCYRDVDDSKCIVVDLRGRVPDGTRGEVTAGAGGVAESTGALTELEFESLLRDALDESFRERKMGMASPVTSLAGYIKAGRQYLHANLEGVFGLLVESECEYRMPSEILVLIGDENPDLEWDFRAPVICSGAYARNATKSDDFVIYPDREAYLRPLRPVRGKHLTHTIIDGSILPTISDYVAIFEITSVSMWVNLLVPSMEQRLMATLDRARLFQAHERDETGAVVAQPVHGILDVVAVIGVVSLTSCQSSVLAHVTMASTPLLFELMTAGRFVFIRQPYSG